jgi:hypothetical protein
MHRPSTGAAAMAAIALVTGVALLTGVTAVSATNGSSPGAVISTNTAASVNRDHAPRTMSGTAVRTTLSQSTAVQAVAISCKGREQVRPSRLALACASGQRLPGNYLTGLRWMRWGWHGSAYGTGEEHPATCVGSTNVVVVLWRLRAWPGHAGLRHFTQMTVINRGALTPWSPLISTVRLWP